MYTYAFIENCYFSKVSELYILYFMRCSYCILYKVMVHIFVSCFIRYPYCIFCTRYPCCICHKLSKFLYHKVSIFYILFRIHIVYSKGIHIICYKVSIQYVLQGIHIMFSLRFLYFYILWVINIVYFIRYPYYVIMCLYSYVQPRQNDSIFAAYQDK